MNISKYFFKNYKKSYKQKSCRYAFYISILSFTTLGSIIKNFKNFAGLLKGDAVSIGKFPTMFTRLIQLSKIKVKKKMNYLAGH